MLAGSAILDRRARDRRAQEVARLLEVGETDVRKDWKSISLCLRREVIRVSLERDRLAMKNESQQRVIRTLEGEAAEAARLRQMIIKIQEIAR